MSAPPAFRQQLLAAIPRLRRYARSLVFDVHAADDLVQSVLERALGHWRQFDPRRDIVLWLLSIAHNAHLDGLRRDRRLEVLPPERIREAMDAAQPPGTDIGLRLDLVAALERLPHEQRSALLLVLVEQLSYAEAAEVLQVPAGTVMSRVSRARVVMRAWLDGSVPASSPARLDGELDADARHRIEAWLHEHPEAAARTRLWAADRDALRARLDPVLDEPVPLVLQHTAQRVAPPTRWAQAAAAAGLLVAGGLIGAAATWQWQGQQVLAAQTAAQAGTPAGWVQRAALAHSVYVPEPRHAVEVKAQEEHLARWLTRRIDIPVKLFDLRDEGFELVGGRLLPDAAGKSAQLMYESTDTGAPKQRVTVYLRKPDANAPTAFRYQQQGELGLFYWVEAGAGYALVGALPKERLLALAQAIYKQQPAPMPASAAAR